jgi:carboxyl-terminal processing protease
MTKLIRQLLIILMVVGASCVYASPTVVDMADLHPTVDQERATKLIHYFIDRFHYRNVRLDDKLSEQIFDRYLEALDGNRSYLLASDVAEFSRYRDKLDDAIDSADLTPAYEIFKRASASAPSTPSPCSMRVSTSR